MKPVKVPLHSIGRPVGLEPDAVCIWFGTLFHSKLIRRMRDPGLLWTQPMVPNLCFRKQQPLFAHNFKRKSICYGWLSFQSNFVLLVK